MVFATADTTSEEGCRRSFAFHTQRGMVKREVLVCHRTDRGLVGHEECKVGADVRGTVLVPIERNHAVSLCAASQTPNLLSYLLFHLDPRASFSEAPTACLGRVGLRRRRHHKAPRQLAHEPNTDARRFPCCMPCPAAPRPSPAAVGQHQWPRVRLQLLQVLVETFLTLLCLDHRLPSPSTMPHVGVEGEALVQCFVALGTVRAKVDKAGRPRVEAHEAGLGILDLLRLTSLSLIGVLPTAQVALALLQSVAHRRAAFGVIHVHSDNQLSLARVNSYHMQLLGPCCVLELGNGPDATLGHRGERGAITGLLGPHLHTGADTVGREGKVKAFWTLNTCLAQVDNPAAPSGRTVRVGARWCGGWDIAQMPCHQPPPSPPT